MVERLIRELKYLSAAGSNLAGASSSVVCTKMQILFLLIEDYELL